MTGRRIRRLLLLAVAAGVAYWIYHDRPTVSGIVDKLAGPLLGSRAAVKSSERNRVVGEASTAISEQSNSTIAALREGMTRADVQELLGSPERIERTRSPEGAELEHWIYGGRTGRILIFQDGRVASIRVR